MAKNVELEHVGYAPVLRPKKPPEPEINGWLIGGGVILLLFLLSQCS